MVSDIIMATSSNSKKAPKIAKKGLLASYLKTIKCRASKVRYQQKLTYINNVDPYELPKDHRIDNVELCLSVTYVHVWM